MFLLLYTVANFYKRMILVLIRFIIVIKEQLAFLHDQNKNGFFGAPLFSSQADLFEYF